ncbi:hypothetical protein EDB86DRAFT_2298702 [Lactarius hatsudake]|nr:hypothetical protein EDB86DRAFT_2298702 [Lactarius hatsudake]
MPLSALRSPLRFSCPEHSGFLARHFAWQRQMLIRGKGHVPWSRWHLFGTGSESCSGMDGTDMASSGESFLGAMLGWRGVGKGNPPGTRPGWRGVGEGRLPGRRLGWHGFRGGGKVSSLLGFKSSTTSALLESCGTSAAAPAEMARLPFVSPALPRKLSAKVGHTQTKPLTILLVVVRLTLLPNEGGHACRWRSFRDRRRGMCGCRTTRSRTGRQWVLNRKTRVARTPERTEFRARTRRWGVPDTTLGPRVRVPQIGGCWRSWPLDGDRRSRY